MPIFKKFYNWVMLKAHSPYGKHILFVIAFVESILSLFPLTILFVALALANTKKTFQFSLISTLGAVTGAIAGYSIGHFAWIGQNNEYTDLAHFFFNNVPAFSMEAYHNMQAIYREWDFIIIFTAGFTPMPFELITITSGVFHINFILFVLSAVVGRGARYFLLGFLIWRYGEKIKTFIEKYFNILAFGLTTCVISVLVVLKLII
jgi:membrane protein YqaA with SNARE-associated domain